MLWCTLTRTDSTEFDADDRSAFYARPQMSALCSTPDSVLNDAAMVRPQGAVAAAGALAGRRPGGPAGREGALTRTCDAVVVRAVTMRF